MTGQRIAEVIQAVLIQHFNIQPEDFDWNQPLEKLDVNFKILGHLVYLEQLLEKELGTKIPLLENIGTAVHTPNDILELIEKI